MWMICGASGRGFGEGFLVDWLDIWTVPEDVWE